MVKKSPSISSLLILFQRRIVPLTLCLTLIQSGCSIKIGPEFVNIPPSERAPIFRIGDITESVTGSWAQSPTGAAKSFSAFRSALTDELKKRELASRFSPSSTNLNLNIDLISDHDDDGPRLSNLGGLSMITFGIIPLNFFSEWLADCKVTVTTPDGQSVADYTFQERGTYKIWAFPITMFTLLGAGIRGDQDWRRVQACVANNLASKIAEALDKDYDTLAAKAKKQTVTATASTQSASAPEAAPKPLII
ncbi:MAG: hypothetical protein EXS63_02550 [Candidatus Omnitrophica bacterium]|nr:hypothetical protein [Candidatus Omnitrophota bacterium]